MSRRTFGRHVASTGRRRCRPHRLAERALKRAIGLRDPLAGDVEMGATEAMKARRRRARTPHASDARSELSSDASAAPSDELDWQLKLTSSQAHAWAPSFMWPYRGGSVG